jgi:Tfp pilus assembly protein PilX
MESAVLRNHREEHPLTDLVLRTRKERPTERGIALLMAIIITLVVFLLVTSTLYVITQGTKISGPRMVYKTACEASDGAVELAKDAIEQTYASQSIASSVMSFSSGSTLSSTLNINNESTVFSLSLQGTLGITYNGTITITRLYQRGLVGSTIEYPPRAFTGKNIAIFFRIDTVVTGANNVSCSNAVLYRHVI